ncbi:hypothetical protein BDK51DRAFT_49270 [Blyttiomyces helicus]|uniref:Uncharacterized protein n=1 Tax=Blyttiomyces helicus TaxID=388810 RepID=A0A4P9VTX0_9FUNG|nr:hypothetical protein BDK51DRAFT_49270 [Blyttiomyces helicus]|eukprot:RKO82991.1 hypothetical protein BDK51DRAFT_49270 [Blyttiomyces helicus]
MPPCRQVLRSDSERPADAPGPTETRRLVRQRNKPRHLVGINKIVAMPSEHSTKHKKAKKSSNAAAKPSHSSSQDKKPKADPIPEPSSHFKRVATKMFLHLAPKFARDAMAGVHEYLNRF